MADKNDTKLHEEPQLAGGRASRLQVIAIAIAGVVLVGVALFALDHRHTAKQVAGHQPAATTALPAVGSAKTNGDTPAGKITMPVPGNASPDVSPPHLRKG